MVFLFLFFRKYNFYFLLYFSNRQRAVANPASTSNDPSIFKAHVLFQALKGAMEDDKDNLIERVRGIYCFKVKNGPGGKEGMWIINAKTGKGSVEYNGKGKIILQLLFLFNVSIG